MDKLHWNPPSLSPEPDRPIVFMGKSDHYTHRAPTYLGYTRFDEFGCVFIDQESSFEYIPSMIDGWLYVTAR